MEEEKKKVNKSDRGITDYIQVVSQFVRVSITKGVSRKGRRYGDYLFESGQLK